uniref:NAD_binding_3 domain-containing protein n=1 Tax=Heterorhabditis bacteriophora TaxID=37862 RepID=A0A1I7W7B2_HETBA
MRLLYIKVYYYRSKLLSLIKVLKTPLICREVDLVVEVAHPKIVDQYAVTILESCDFFIGSPSSLADKSLYDSIQHTANLNRRSVFIPSGAFWGGTDIQKMADTGMLKKKLMDIYQTKFRMSDWHIVEVDVLGPDGFSVYTKRKNPSKPGAVTGQLTYYSFLTSLKGKCTSFTFILTHNV